MIKPKLRRIKLYTDQTTISLSSSFKLMDDPRKMKWNCYAEKVVKPNQHRQLGRIVSFDINDTFQIIQYIKAGLSL